MGRLRRRGHEVNNALSTALLSTQIFFDVSRAEEVSPNALAELGAAADGMVDALQRLKTLIEPLSEQRFYRLRIEDALPR